MLVSHVLKMLGVKHQITEKSVPAYLLMKEMESFSVKGVSLLKYVEVIVPNEMLLFL